MTNCSRERGDMRCNCQSCTIASLVEAFTTRVSELAKQFNTTFHSYVALHIETEIKVYRNFKTTTKTDLEAARLECIALLVRAMKPVLQIEDLFRQVELGKDVIGPLIKVLPDTWFMTEENCKDMPEFYLWTFVRGQMGVLTPAQLHFQELACEIKYEKLLLKLEELKELQKDVEFAEAEMAKARAAGLDIDDEEVRKERKDNLEMVKAYLTDPMKFHPAEWGRWVDDIP